jgi:hypothetical protein
METRLGWRMSLAALLLLSSTACMVPHPKLATQGPPPRPREGENDRDRQRQQWIESMHRAAPGVDWRQIERENLDRNVAQRAQLAGAAAAGAPVNGAFWLQRGATTQTGRTWATTVAGDGTTLLVGSGDEGGGLFSGTPGANSWTQRGNLIGTGAQQLVVVPGPPETWVAVGSNYSEVWVSTDQGASWNAAQGVPQEPCGFLSTRLLREAGSSRTVYLLITVPFCVQTTTYTLLRSADGGLNWVSLVSGNYTASPDLWIDRVKPGPLYLLTDAGFKSSSDHGATFTPLGSLSIPGAYDNLRLAGSEAGAPTFYALVSNNTQNTTFLYTSADGGRSWSELQGQLGDYFRSNGAFTASISTPGIVLLGGVNAHRSTNGGVSFTAVNDWSQYYGDPAHLLHADIRGLDFLVYQGTETLFANTDGGTFRSTDLGATFSNLTQIGMINAEYYSTLTSKNDPNLIAAGSQDQGLQQSTATQLPTLGFDQLISGDYGHLSSTAGDHNMLYAVYPGFVAVLDHESPPQSVDISNSFPPARNRSWMPNILADPADANAVYLTGDPLYRLYKDSSGWHSTAMPQNFSGGTGDYLTALAISHADQTHWYAASSQGRLWYSHDQGATWAESASKGPAAHYFYGTALLASPTRSATCYVGGAGYSGPAVYKTTDGGVTWQEMGDGLPSTLVLGLAFDDPVKQDLFAAADAGAFVYDQASARWKSIVAGNSPIHGFWSVEGVSPLLAVRFGTYGKGIWDYSPTGGACVSGTQSLCLGQNRFEVGASWTTATASGTAQVVQLTPDTGYLYFFDPQNVEAVIKIVDGCGLNKDFWVFAGGLTNVQTVISVRDSLTGTVRTYTNPQNTAFQPIQDTAAFATCNAPVQPPPADARAGTAAGGSASTPDSVSGSSLLLNNDRFKVDVRWQTADGKTGTGTPVSVTGDTGYFWFFNSANVEMVIKVLSGCGLNGKYWVFAGGLTNVLTTITVTDTQTGTQQTYTNPQGKPFQPIQDTAAFSTCP